MLPALDMRAKGATGGVKPGVDIGEPESRRTALREGDSALVGELRRWDMTGCEGDKGGRRERRSAG